MTPAKFEQELKTARNPRKPSAYLLVLWVALSDKVRDEQQLEVAGHTIGPERVEKYSTLAEKHPYRPLQLACGIIAEAPPTAQLAVLIGAIRAAVANEVLVVEENLLLRFLAELTGHSIDEVFEEETEVSFPDLPGGSDLLAALEDSPSYDSAHNLLTLIGRLRKDLSMADGGWWDEALAATFTPGAARETRTKKKKETKATATEPPPGKRKRILVMTSVAIGAIVLAVILLSGKDKDRDQLELARKVGTIEAYEEFLDRFPDSALADAARGEIGRLQAAQAAMSTPPPEPPSTPTPEPPEPPEVPVEVTPDPDDKDDPEWLVQSGTRADCEDYLARSPEGRNYDKVKAHLVNLEIATIRKGSHEPIGEHVEVDLGGGEEVSIVEINNSAAAPLTVLYLGDQVYRLEVPPGETKPFVIQNGIYTVAVTGEGAGNPLLGRYELLGGRYSYKAGSGN